MYQLTQKEYADNQRCPNCHSTSIGWDRRTMEYQDAFCHECDATWVEVSKVSGYEDLDLIDVDK